MSVARHPGHRAGRSAPQQGASECRTRGTRPGSASLERSGRTTRVGPLGAGPAYPLSLWTARAPHARISRGDQGSADRPAHSQIGDAGTQNTHDARSTAGGLCTAESLAPTHRTHTLLETLIVLRDPWRVHTQARNLAVDTLFTDEHCKASPLRQHEALFPIMCRRHCHIKERVRGAPREGLKQHGGPALFPTVHALLTLLCHRCQGNQQWLRHRRWYSSIPNVQAISLQLRQMRRTRVSAGTLGQAHSGGADGR